jgi:4-amino-4-deoxy-L-arabinose transferase-like glycosyltransferase
MATMSVAFKVAPPRESVPRRVRLALLGILAVGVFGGVFAFLSSQPAITLDRARGLYMEEGGDTPFRWISSRAEFPLDPHSGPTELTLVLSIARWPRQPQIPVQLETDAGALGTVPIAEQSRHIYALIPPGATFMRINTAVARPPGDWRWLGVQLLGIAATPSGWPLRAVGLALLFAAVSIMLALGMNWAIQRGYGAIAAITLLGLALRVLWIADSPPLMHRDEAVSLVDAWNLAQTGRDHLGHFLPLAAFEAYGDWLSPLLTYVLLPWVALFGPQPLIARLVTAVFGTLAIPCVYGLVKELRIPPAAIWAALVTALSPWQIFLSRVAIQPAMVVTSWTLCLWAAIRFVRSGQRADALALAIAAGVALYAYPTMKMAVPLLLALAVPLALRRHGWRASIRWWLPALVLSGLWLPFVLNTLFNPFNNLRLQMVIIKAASPSEWFALWWHNYAVYFQPNFYYFVGGVRKIIQGIPNHGMALGAEAVLLFGLVGVPIRRLARRRSTSAVSSAATEPRPNVATVPAQSWLLLIGALLISPLPASLTIGQPHAFRAATIAPVYAVLVGIGAGEQWRLLGWLPSRARAITRWLVTVTLAIVLIWQGLAWFTTLVQRYPSMATNTWFFADSEVETMRRVVSYAPRFDEIWLDTGTIGRPYIFLLIAQPMPPAEAQAQLVFKRNPPHINNVTSIGPYHFRDLDPAQVPLDLPALEAIPTQNSGPGYLLQEWRHENRRVLVVRSMTTQVEPATAVDDSNDDEDIP